MSVQVQRLRKSGIAAAIAVASFACDGVIVAVAQGTPTAATGDFEEIIVTAQRKEEGAQDVPISISVMNTQRLRDMNITSTQSLLATVPSLTVGQNGQGSRMVEAPAIRGQGASFQGFPGVIVYLAEVPLPPGLTLSMQGGAGNYLDLANVQVLKGPQGTLFGRNTTGGAILLEPNRPTDEFEGHVQVQAGNYNDRELQAIVNVPIVEDTLLARVAFERVRRDGFTENVTYDNKDLDNKNYWAARLGVTWRPTDSVENYLMAYYSESETHGTGTVHGGFNVPYFKLIGICDRAGMVACSVYQDISDQAIALGSRKVATGSDPYEKTESWGLTDKLSWELSEDMTLRAIGSYARLKSYYTYDGDGTVIYHYDNNVFTGRTIPRDYPEQYTGELQLQGSAFSDALDYIVGAFYTKVEPAGLQASGALNICPYSITSLCLKDYGSQELPYDMNPFNSVSRYGVTSESYAVYAQGTWDFGALQQSLEGLRLTVGYRYTWDEITGYHIGFKRTSGGATAKCNWNSAIVVNPYDPVAGCEVSASVDDSNGTWTVGLDYSVSDDLMVYGKVSKGYKAGGFNAFAVRPETVTYGPEELTAYEAGVKSEFQVANVPTRLNLTAFYLDYKSIQQSTSDRNATTGAQGAQILSDGVATIKGIEFEAALRPADFLELGVTGSYTDGEFDKDPVTIAGFFPVEDCSGAFINPGSVADFSCVPMQYLPEWIVSTYAQVHFAENLRLFVGYSWTDDQHTKAVFLEKYSPNQRLDSFGLLNASVEWTNVGGGPIDLSLFGTNLTDKDYRIGNNNIYQQGSIGVTSKVYGEPRMFGMRMRYNF